MNAIAFDTLRFVKRLQAAGYTPEQAEAQAEAYAEAVGDALATKQDLELTKQELQHSISTVKSEVEAMATTLRGEIREANLNLIKWIVPLLVGQTAVIAALVKLF
jgi:hypothetical protein